MCTWWNHLIRLFNLTIWIKKWKSWKAFYEGGGKSCFWVAVVKTDERSRFSRLLLKYSTSSLYDDITLLPFILHFSWTYKAGKVVHLKHFQQMLVCKLLLNIMAFLDGKCSCSVLFDPRRFEDALGETWVLSPRFWQWHVDVCLREAPHCHEDMTVCQTLAANKKQRRNNVDGVSSQSQSEGSLKAEWIHAQASQQEADMKSERNIMTMKKIIIIYYFWILLNECHSMIVVSHLVYILRQPM